MLLIRGLVQGVGFRPFICRMAKERGLKGRVENRNDGVLVILNGPENTVLDFRDAIRQHAPAASSIEGIEVRETENEEFPEFEIVESGDVSDRVTEISPDIAVCQACLEDIKKQPHRIGYPLINCTHCGPRFSIIRDLPYDRANTTMSEFVMCPKCRAEYEDLTDRRFHAQPVACNKCGPVYRLESPEGETRDFQEILRRVWEIIASDGLLQV